MSAGLRLVLGEAFDRSFQEFLASFYYIVVVYVEARKKL